MLTEKQKRVLDFIIEFINNYSRPPSVREIGAHFGFNSTGTTRDYLSALENKGFIRLKKGVARGIELLVRATGIPLLGRVSAGKPIEAVENIEGYVDVSGLFPERDLFALRVKGESMRDAGILPGDIAVVRKQFSAEDGDIVVAVIVSEAVIKRLRIKRKGICLESAHPAYPPIYKKNIQIIGKVIGIIRHYLR